MKNFKILIEREVAKMKGNTEIEEKKLDLSNTCSKLEIIGKVNRDALIDISARIDTLYRLQIMQENKDGIKTNSCKAG